MSLLQRVLLALILLLGAAARFVALDSVPSTIHPDEAMDGNQGLQATLQHSHQLFYRGNYGREGLFINAIGVSVRSFGNNGFGLRLPSAIVGTSAILLIYLLASELFTPAIGLWAAFFLATSFWHLNFSRIAFRAILVPTLLLAAFYGLFKAQRTKRLHPAIWGGIAFGLGFHSYIAFRIAPLVALVPLTRTRLRIAAAWCVAALFAAFPIAIYFLVYPEDFSSRTQGLAVWHQPDALHTLAIATAKSLLMFNWKGDCNDWHNLACEPQLPLPIGALFLVGIATSLWRRSFFLLTWLVVMLLPAILAWEGTPHALRAIGTIPAVMLLAAIGADAAWKRIGDRKALQIAFLAVVVGAGLFEYYRYFSTWANSPGMRVRSKSQLTEIGLYFNTLPADTPRFAVLNDDSTAAQTVMFLTHDHPQPKYLSVEQLLETSFPAGSVIVPLSKDPRIFAALRERGIQLDEEPIRDFTAARVR